MSPEIIREQIDAHPFTPFRIYVSGGATYDVETAQFIFVTRRDIMIGIEPDRHGLPRRSVRVDPLHVTRIEPIGNGDEDNAEDN